MSDTSRSDQTTTADTITSATTTTPRLTQSVLPPPSPSSQQQQQQQRHHYSIAQAPLPTHDRHLLSTPETPSDGAGTTATAPLNTPPSHAPSTSSTHANTIMPNQRIQDPTQPTTTTITSSSSSSTVHAHPTTPASTPAADRSTPTVPRTTTTAVMTRLPHAATTTTTTKDSTNIPVHHHHTHMNNPLTRPTLVAAVDIRVVASMLLNFFSSTGLIVLNKIVMDRFHFRYATTLTFLHLLSTFLLLLATSSAGLFHIKRLPLLPVAKLAVGSMGFICLTNLSLQHNSIGFYQVMKVMTTPTVVAIEALFYQKYLHKTLKIALIPICMGVIFTTATDFQLNLVGACYAVAGVIVTAFYQIWSGTLQSSLDCNALQLQTFVAPLAALFILPFVPLFDRYTATDPSAIWHYKLTSNAALLILATCFFGFLVNISIFLVIGRSSPVSYNVLGHSKTVVILLSDFMLFSRPYTFKSTVGILITLVGVFWYTQIKLNMSRLESKARGRSDESSGAIKPIVATKSPDVDEEAEDNEEVDKWVEKEKKGLLA